MAKEKVYAKSKYVGQSAQKTRLVVDMVRGENALYAAEMLNFVNKASALPVKKTIESAIANAEFNHELDKTKLVIVEARVDEAPTLKRGRAVSKGRYHQILKRNCHIIIGVAESNLKSEIAEDLAKLKEKEKEQEVAKEKQTEDTAKTKVIEQKPELIQDMQKQKGQGKKLSPKGLFRRVQSRGN